MLFGFFFLSVLAFACGAPTSLTGDLIDALGGLISNISVTIALESLVTNLADLSFNVTNPLLVELTLERVVLSAGINTTEYISFDHTFEDPIVVPILGTTDSGAIEDVALTQGGLATLDIVSQGSLDLINLDVYLREATINGKLGIPVNATGLTQKNVPTTYDTPFDKQGSS
ncbi:hypothetical protein ARMSODRAFT_222618 [Armillaria solidipes]|uniref:Late embryogenesis abundant protein LEA-2 subgroup domain-containing protein n=1 Tax=Armillaria solidipes TaxID=1076256 RepID=A0A2H3BZQ6_9AGAR|nr:hypothetical protein ARMSODRAFT_222618 [Armillaria solidipes]